MTIADVGLSCSTCFYFVMESGRRNGHCARFPPTRDDYGEAVFPWMEESDAKTTSCGEWSSDQQPPESLGLAEVPP